eukprot:CAMPEP_0171365380 /NCGR_PEP_ID=MMETSP0879-20121228/4649_1 /TAXON_ID=67004 /ORGANISM="Thalassiosira weissflogii, Strain CCMP1336" /LENGTH=72 /DNA_ID=CAMNT_0011872947 /DNA_START=712 /DNA_END=926 /DNA_ORIENTATION=-
MASRVSPLGVGGNPKEVVLTMHAKNVESRTKEILVYIVAVVEFDAEKIMILVRIIALFIFRHNTHQEMATIR